MVRRIGVVLGAAVLLLAGQTARAQIVSVYGLFSPTHISHVQTGIVGSVNQYTGFWAPGFGGGLTLNFLNLPVAKLGVDVRGSTKPGTTGADTAEGGLRLGFNPPAINLKPYVQAGVGYLATRTTNVSTGSSGATFNNKYATVGIHAGVDHAIFPLVDFRVIEVGYARAFNVGLSTGSVNDANVFTIGTGLVVRF